MLRQDCLKVAEARVRALTREVGSLKEDLRREVKRRERTTISVKEAEELREEAEKRVKQLEYSKRKLEQEGFTAQKESKVSAAKSRAAATSAREELAAYESSVAEQAAASHHHLQQVSHHMQKLQALLFSPAEPLDETVMAPGVAPVVQSEVKEIVHALSRLSSSLPGEQACLALPAPPSPCRHAKPDSKAEHMELHRLRAEIALLQAQQQVQRDERCAEQAANDMSNLICEYRSTLARMKKQVDELHLRLEDTCQERESLQQQVVSLKKTINSGTAGRKVQQTSSLKLRPEVCEEDEDAKRLIQDIRGLKHRCQSLEAQADSLGVTNCELQTALAEREERLQQQRHVIADLEATINAQSSDIQTALQLVTHKHSGVHRGSADADVLVPAWRAANSPSQAASRQRPVSFQHCPEGTDVSWCQHYSTDAAADSQLSPHRLPPHRKRFHQRCSSMDTLCKDMQQLDAQIAHLDLNLASASQRLHH